MKFLLTIRVLTITAIYLIVSKWNDELIIPLSIFRSIIHEVGHGVGSLVGGGEVSGLTLAPDCPCLYACTRGGNALITLLGGNFFTISAAYFFVYLGRVVSKIGGEYILFTFFSLSVVMFLTVRLVNDERVLSLWLVGIYILLFVFFILTQSGWGGAFLIFFGVYNLFIILKDALTGGILSDISRYTRLSPYIPGVVWIAVWFGIVGYMIFDFFNEVANTKVDWIEGRRFFRNMDAEKVLLFLSISPNLIGFAFDHFFKSFSVEFKTISDGIRRFLSI